jgi:hypothetical protein
MAYEMRPNDGSLFRNKDKRPDKRDPDLTGRIMLPDGTVHWFKAWSKVTGAGDKWLSCQIGDRCQQQQPMASSVPPLDAHGAAKGNAFVADDDSDIPF